MKFILFCQNPYAFGILEPIMAVLKERGESYLWFIKENIAHKFPFTKEPNTSKIEDLISFESDVIFVPGNEVPHYLRGLKVQIFHGLAGEKKGHFRIRHYFDLYLTQGPYFTNRFMELKDKYNNFDVIETGWPKLDIFRKELHKYDKEKESIKAIHGVDKIILYAPTFSPSLTSGHHIYMELKELSENKKYLILIKFHDLMAADLVEKYKILASENENIIYEEERNIVKFLLMADLMISDTSSVVYEFLLLNKPVITFKTSAENIQWDNRETYEGLTKAVGLNLLEDPFRGQRQQILESYHPYQDGNAALRMIEAVTSYIKEHGIPTKRELSFLRQRKIKKIFGK